MIIGQIFSIDSINRVNWDSDFVVMSGSWYRIKHCASLKFHITRALLKAVTIDVQGSGSGAALGVSWHLTPAGRNIAVGDRCPIALTDRSYHLHHLVSCQRRRHHAPGLFRHMRTVIRSAQLSSRFTCLVLTWSNDRLTFLHPAVHWPQDTTELLIFCVWTHASLSSVMITSS